MNISLVDTNEIKWSAYNPRITDEKRLSIIELSLRKLGFLAPIYATRDGEILSGHQRHLVSRRMGMTHVPVFYVDDMDIHTRKAINIAFNRGTNDLAAEDTPEKLTLEIQNRNLNDIAAAMPDSADPCRCMNFKMVDTEILIKANSGRWKQYAVNAARALYGHGVIMPIVATEDNLILNGLGRVPLYAEKGFKQCPVVYVSEKEAEFARVMMNYLSMDFNIHEKYADLLRYNSFRRPRGARTYLGRAFTFEILRGKPSKNFDIYDSQQKAEWVNRYGTYVLDFGAGLMDETRILNEVGISCIPFEPYVLDGGVIDKEKALKINRAFLERVASGRPFETIFMSAVLNSVPFIENRRHIICLLNALSCEKTKVMAVSASVKQIGCRVANGAEYINASDYSRLQFKLDYEKNVTLADFSETPKVQKYHTPEEWRALWAERFAYVKISESSNNVECVCQYPLPVDLEKLEAAIEFEFNLPYPDGTRMGLTEEAKTAFFSYLKKNRIDSHAP